MTNGHIEGYVIMPGVAALNRRLAKLGLVADVRVINCNAGLAFGRRASSIDPAAGNSPELVANTVTNLRNSTADVAATLGLTVGPDGVANLTAVGFSLAPHEIDADQLVQRTRGAGFLLTENPHPACLALVCDGDLVFDLALLTPFADAPPVWGVYIDEVDGKLIVVTFTIMAAWHRLPRNEGDLVRRTVAEVKARVEAKGAVFSARNLWVFVGPAASEGFEFKGTRSGKLDPEDRARFVHEELIPNPKFGAEGEPEFIVMQYLNLRGWVTDLFRRDDLTVDADGNPAGGVPVLQVFELAHNTVTSTCYKSKRGLMGRGVAAPGSVIASNGFVGVIRRLAA